MHFRHAKFGVLFASTLIVVLSGCNRGISLNIVSFSIGETRGEICALNNNLALVLWSDAAVDYSGGVGGDPIFYGEFRLADGRKVPWNCSTGDGKTGRVNIAGESYELAKGGFFIVRTKDKAPKVEQLPLEILRVGESPQTSGLAHLKLEELAKTDAKFGAFVKEASERK